MDFPSPTFFVPFLNRLNFSVFGKISFNLLQ